MSNHQKDVFDSTLFEDYTSKLSPHIKNHESVEDDTIKICLPRVSKMMDETNKTIKRYTRRLININNRLLLIQLRKRLKIWLIKYVTIYFKISLLMLDGTEMIMHVQVTTQNIAIVYRYYLQLIIINCIVRK